MTGITKNKALPLKKEALPCHFSEIIKLSQQHLI
jgi:hypothetical protein